MLHTLAKQFLRDETLAWQTSELRKGPFYKLPEELIKRISTNDFGIFYLELVSATESLFLEGEIPENRRELAQTTSERFGAWLPEDLTTNGFSTQHLYPEVVRTALQIIDQIADDQHKYGKRTRLLTPNEVTSLVYTYWLNRAIVGWMTGLWAPIQIANGLMFKPCAEYENALKRHQFANLWDTTSFQSFSRYSFECINIATKGNFGKIGQYLPIAPQIIELFAEAILDRFFFLNARFISNSDAGPLTSQAKGIAGWLAAIFIGKCFNIGLPNDPRLHQQLGLDPAILSAMLAHTKENSVQDKGVILKNNEINIGQATFSHACSLYHDLMAYAQTSKKTVNAGDWFEHVYAMQLLQEENIADDFVVMRGHQSVDESIKYDYDLLLFDKRNEVLYFIQLKYRFNRIQYYWSDNFQEFFGGFKGEKKDLSSSAIWKGIKQLNGLRSVLDNPRVKDQVNAELRKKSLPVLNTISAEKCRFLLVHTVTAFDFGLVDGIALYEFNTFRNLLLRGRIGFKANPNSEVMENRDTGVVMPLENPDLVIQILAEELTKLAPEESPFSESIERILDRSIKLRYLVPYRAPRIKFLGMCLFSKPMYASLPVS